MNLLLLFLELFLATLVYSLTDIYNTPICCTFNNVNMTFVNVWQIFNVLKATGQLWVPVAKGACFENKMDCTILSPVCAVTNDRFFKTFANQCLLEAEQKTTGTVWNIAYNGICSSDASAASSQFQAFDSTNNQQYNDVNSESASSYDTKSSDTDLEQSVNSNRGYAYTPAARTYSSLYDNSKEVDSTEKQQSSGDYDRDSDSLPDKLQNSELFGNYFQKPTKKLETKSNTPALLSEQKLLDSSYYNKGPITSAVVSDTSKSHSLSYNTARSVSTGEQLYTSASYKQSSKPNQVAATPSKLLSSILARPSYNYNQATAPTIAVSLASHTSSSYNSPESSTSKFYTERKNPSATTDYKQNFVLNPVYLQAPASTARHMVPEKYRTAQCTQRSNEFNHNLIAPRLSLTYAPSPHLAQVTQPSFIPNDLTRNQAKLYVMDYNSVKKSELPDNYNQRLALNANISTSQLSRPSANYSQVSAPTQAITPPLQSHSLLSYQSASSASSEQQQQPNTLAEYNQHLSPLLYVTAAPISPREFNTAQRSHYMAPNSNSAVLNTLLSRLPPSLNSGQSLAFDRYNSANEMRAPTFSVNSVHSLSRDDGATSLSSGYRDSYNGLQTSTDYKQSSESKTFAPLVLQTHLSPAYKIAPSMGLERNNRVLEPKISPIDDKNNKVLILNSAISAPPNTKSSKLYNVALSPATGDQRPITPIPTAYVTTAESPDINGLSKSYWATSAKPEKYNEKPEQLSASITMHSENLNQLSVQNQTAETISVTTPNPSYNRLSSPPFLDLAASSSTPNINTNEISDIKIEQIFHQSTKRNLAPSEQSYGDVASDSNQEQNESESYSQDLIMNNFLQMMLPVIMQKQIDFPHLINTIFLQAFKFLMMFL